MLILSILRHQNVCHVHGLSEKQQHETTKLDEIWAFICKNYDFEWTNRMFIIIFSFWIIVGWFATFRIFSFWKIVRCFASICFRIIFRIFFMILFMILFMIFSFFRCFSNSGYYILYSNWFQWNSWRNGINFACI